MSDWEEPQRAPSVERREPVVEEAGRGDGLTPYERFARELAVLKRDEGTERDPLVRVQRVIERLRRPI